MVSVWGQRLERAGNLSGLQRNFLMFGSSRVLKIKANKCLLVAVFIRKGKRGNEKTLKCELNHECHELVCFSHVWLCKNPAFSRRGLVRKVLLSKEKTMCVTKKRNILKVYNLRRNGRVCYGEKLQQ